MKAPAFDYVRASTISEAFSAYESYGEDAVYLAGGHSVLPALNLRLQAPSAVIDISHIDELSGIGLVNGWLRIGAMTRHVQVLNDPLIAQYAPLLAAAAPHVAHPAIRNRGTIGGSVSLADPASEFPAMMLALRAELEIAGPDGTRRVAADDFFRDLYETTIQPGEILRAVFVPPRADGTVSVFDELARRRGDYALVGAGIQAVLNNGIVNRIDVAFFSVSHMPLRARSVEATLTGKPLNPDTIAAAQTALLADLDPSDDPQMPAKTRVHLAQVLLGRLLEKLGAET